MPAPAPGRPVTMPSPPVTLPAPSVPERPVTLPAPGHPCAPPPGCPVVQPVPIHGCNTSGSAAVYGYVGYGDQQFQMVAMRRSNQRCCLCIGGSFGALAMSALVLVLLFPSTVNCDTKEVWSTTKTAWCCVKEGKGCASSTPEESVTLPAPNTQLDYNCLTYEVWSPMKSAWCCAHEGKGCPEKPVTLPSPEQPEMPVTLPAPERPVTQPAPEQPVVLPAPERPVIQPAPEQPVPLPA